MAKRGNLNKLTNSLENNISRLINVSHVCSVAKLSDDKKHADVQPMALTEDGNVRAMLLNVPISKNLLEYVSEGSVVIVLFTDRNMNHFDGTNSNFVIENSRSHSINDGVIVGVL